MKGLSKNTSAQQSVNRCGTWVTTNLLRFHLVHFFFFAALFMFLFWLDITSMILIYDANVLEVNKPYES